MMGFISFDEKIRENLLFQILLFYYFSAEIFAGFFFGCGDFRAGRILDGKCNN